MAPGRTAPEKPHKRRKTQNDPPRSWRTGRFKSFSLTAGTRGSKADNGYFSNSRSSKAVASSSSGASTVHS